MIGKLLMDLEMELDTGLLLYPTYDHEMWIEKYFLGAAGNWYLLVGVSPDAHPYSKSNHNVVYMRNNDEYGPKTLRLTDSYAYSTVTRLIADWPKARDPVWSTCKTVERVQYEQRTYPRNGLSRMRDVMRENLRVLL